MSPSKIHRYLSSFIRTGFVRQDEHTGAYDLGSRSLELGLSALTRFDVVETAGPSMQKLADQFHATTLLSIWSDRGPVIVRMRQASPAMLVSLSHGSVLPATQSATGQAFLANLPDALTKDLVSRQLRGRKSDNGSGRAPISRADLKKVIAQVRNDGVARVDSSVVPGLRGLAAPILDPEGLGAAVLAIITTDEAFAQPGHPAEAAVKKVCMDLSATQIPSRKQAGSRPT